MRQLNFQNQIDNSYLASDKEWRETATRRVRFLAETRPTFTSETVLTYLERLGLKTKDNRALGGIMQSLARDGIIKAGGYTTASRPERHKAPVRIWESQIYKEGK